MAMTAATGDLAATRAYAHASLAMANLRGVFILILVSFHSCLAYLGSTTASTADFNQPPFLWLAFPIVDERRFFGFDLYCAWEDVHVMAMMFFLSGLFVAPSLKRKGALRFAADRLVRLGAPFLFTVTVLAPLALYPVFARLHPDAGLADYIAAYRSLPFLPNLPAWFLWMLAAMSFAAAGLYAACPRAFEALALIAAGARRRPQTFLIALTAAAAIAYLPLTLAYGPFGWFEKGPFSFQISRPFHYSVFFFAGVTVGAAGLGEGLLAPDGALGRRWRPLLAASPTMLFLWLGLTALTLVYPSFAPLPMRALSALAYVGATVAGVMSLLALSSRFCAGRIGWLETLSRNSLGIFVLHYAPVVWMQYFLLGAPLPPLVKAAIVFGVAFPLSLGLTVAMRRQPLLARLIGEDSARPLSLQSLPL